MRKAGDIMAELGFRPEASDDTKKAFIKNLIRAAYGPTAGGPAGSPAGEFLETQKQQAVRPRKGEQLAFDFSDLIPPTPVDPHRKSG